MFATGNGTVRVTGGSLAGQSLSSSNWEITVSPGQAISGTVTVQPNNYMGSNAVAPFGYTWTWGSRQSSIHEIDGWIRSGVSTWNVPISLTAPSAAGTYYIIFGFNGEYNMNQVLSCTNWGRGNGSPVWNDGNDYWDLSASNLQFAHTNGYVPNWPYLGGNGFSHPDIPVGPIKVVVSSPTSTGNGTVKVTGGSLAGQSLSSSNWEIDVSPGQSISGTVTVRADNYMGSNAVAPFGYTWTWGSRQSSIHEIDGWIRSGVSTWNVPISLTAPSTPGTYYILFGFNGEYNMSQVLSCTNWGRGNGSPVWNDGNDYWDLSASKIQSAHTSGYASAWPYLGGNGYSNTNIPVGPIKVVVSATSTGCSVGTISLGQTRTGSWTSSCYSTHRNSRYARFYRFSLTRSTQVRIDLTSSTDAYLYLLNGGGTTGSVITYDDDGGNNHNSRITRTLSAGTYTIEATTYSSTATGSFSLTLTEVGGSGGGGYCSQNLENGVVCLRDGRFEITGTWTDFANPAATRPLIWTPVADINATGGFQNNPSGIQVVMRVADACSQSGTYWVWLGGFTDGGWSIRVRDTVTGRQKTFNRTRHSGVYPATQRDASSFPCN